MPIDGGALRIEQFDPATHNRTNFSCGTQRLDNFLKLTAKKQQKDDLSKIYVVAQNSGSDILGYHAIHVGMMNVDQLGKRPKAAPQHGELPILFLGQVAVDVKAQGKGIGSILMHHVFLKAETISRHAGCFAIVLDVMSDGNEDAYLRRQSWYEGFGFQPFASIQSRMFMTMPQVRASLVD